jgi:hypothetical protein
MGIHVECELLLGAGELRIQADGHFSIRTDTWEQCGGEMRNEQSYGAAGSVIRENGRLIFEATFDSLFATARGRLSGENFMIERLETEGGEQDVDWIFHRD